MAGKMVFKGQGEAIITENAYPAILNAKEWDNLQQRLTIRREGQHRRLSHSFGLILMRPWEDNNLERLVPQEEVGDHLVADVGEGAPHG